MSCIDENGLVPTDEAYRLLNILNSALKKDNDTKSNIQKLKEEIAAILPLVELCRNVHNHDRVNDVSNKIKEILCGNKKAVRVVECKAWDVDPLTSCKQGFSGLCSAIPCKLQIVVD